MKTKFHSSLVTQPVVIALLATFTQFAFTPRALAQDTTISAADFQRLVYSADLDANLNYIQQFLTDTLGVSTVGTPDSNNPLPNPQEWFIAAYAYLQLAVENPYWFRKDDSTNRVSSIFYQGQDIASFCSDLTFYRANLNWNLWNALEYCYATNLNDCAGQVEQNEENYANTNHFSLDVWRQWDDDAPRVTATSTEVLGAPENPQQPFHRQSATRIAAGRNHSLALEPDGTIVAWGDNTYGQSTIPADVTNAVAIAAGRNYSLALQAGGTVVGWGDNAYGQTNIPPGLSNVVAIAAGSDFSLFLTDTITGGSTGSGGLSLVRAQIPAGVPILFQACNQSTINELDLTGSPLDVAASRLSGFKLLLADVLQLGMPYTLQ